MFGRFCPCTACWEEFVHAQQPTCWEDFVHAQQPTCWEDFVHAQQTCWEDFVHAQQPTCIEFVSTTFGQGSIKITFFLLGDFSKLFETSELSLVTTIASTYLFEYLLPKFP